MLTSLVTTAVPAVEKGFKATYQTWEAIWAYGEAMGWMEKPLEFVLTNWRASKGA